MKKIIISSLCFLSAVLIICASAVGYAYFSKYRIYQGLLGAEVELLFDRLNADGLDAYTYTGTDNNGNPTTENGNADAEWGTEANPYVISDVKHLYNLATLQKLGYFDTHYISNNYNDSGELSEPEGGWSMPYFLVCTPEGKPVTIDGTTFAGTIATIGTEQYPFIGSVKGAFAEGTCTIEGKNSDTSAIYNITVTGDSSDVDVGLFGYVGVIGNVPESDFVLDANGNPTTEAATFEGEVSVISDLLLYDVTVSVQSSAWSVIEKTIDEFLLSHVFSFEALADAEVNEAPHENHHIGILAGHVCYATVEYISVYYSDDNQVAIDLSDTKGWQFSNNSTQAANYMSASGIIGYIDNLNPTIGNGKITAGTGTSNGNLAYSPVGGGGLLSGNKAGYVLASNMYETYHWTDAGEDTTGTVLIKDALAENGTPLCEEWIRDRILWGTENTGEYYFWDGVFTFALSTQKDTIEPTWTTDTQDMQFSIGSTNTDDWAVNTLKGNKSVSAFIKPIESDADFLEALGLDENGDAIDGKKAKQIFILNENGDMINLMSLYEQSVGEGDDVETKYTVPYGSLEYASEQYLSDLYLSYSGMTAEQLDNAFADMSDDYKTPAKLIEDLESGVLKGVYIGMTSSITNVNDLRNMYRINANSVKDTYQYFDMSDMPLVPTAEGVQDYLDYTADFNSSDGATNEYNGYYYYTITKSGIWDMYTYYWVDFATGITTQIHQETDYPWSSDATPREYFGAKTDTTHLWETEPLYTKTVTIKTESGDVTRTATGVVVAIDNDVFYNGGTSYTNGNKAITSGGVQLAKPLGDPVAYFYQPVGTDEWYYFDGDIEISSISDSGQETAGGRSYYTGTANGVEYKGVRLIRYPMYTFSNGYKTEGTTNYMSMVQLTYTGALNFNLGTYNVLWNGTVQGASTGANFVNNMGLGDKTPTVDGSTQNSYIRFNSDGTCYICYTLGTTTRYIKYDVSSNKFRGASSMNEEGTKLRIFSVEGTQDLNYGRVTFEPKDGTGGETFRVDEHVLFANTTTVNGKVEPTDEFSVVSLADLEWNNGKGAMLSSDDLQKKFHLQKGISFGLSFNILNGSLNLGNSDGNGFLQAPVGSMGVEANIPSGCVAFRINKADGDKKIRVIVAVPTSEYHQGEKVGTETIEFPTYKTYFNLWHLEEAGENWIQVFQADDYLARFSLPRSYPYAPGTTPNAGTYITVNKGEVATSDSGATTVTPGDTDYSCSLNGDRVLVAYEFTVTEAMGTGIYILGMSGYQGDETVNDVPMEIVYFSADGVASNGRDGESGSQMGTIDYVYHYKGTEPVYGADGTQTGTQNVNKIVTVRESSSTDAEGKEQYYGYYPSYAIMYFNNGNKNGNAFVLIQEEKVRLRRWVMNDNGTVAEKSTITFDKSGVNHTEIAAYSRMADELNIIPTQ